MPSTSNLGRGHYVANCSNRRSIFLKDQKFIIQDETHSSPSEAILHFEEEVLPHERDLLVRRLLESQSSELKQSQRETLFHTRCKCFENICSSL